MSVDGKEKVQARDAHLVSDATAPLADANHDGKVKFFQLTYGFLTDNKTNEEFYEKQAVNIRIVEWEETGDLFTDTLDMGHPRWPRRSLVQPAPQRKRTGTTN